MGTYYYYYHCTTADVNPNVIFWNVKLSFNVYYILLLRTEFKRSDIILKTIEPVSLYKLLFVSTENIRETDRPTNRLQ